MKNYFHFRGWFLFGFFLGGFASTALADNVMVAKRQVAVVTSGPQGYMRDAQGNLQPLNDGKASYVFLSHPDLVRPAPGENTLLVCLPGHGDTASNFATLWMGLMRSHPNLMVAVPDINEAAYGSINNTSAIVTAIVADTVAHDHVNPKHVILVGYSQGGTEGVVIVSGHPDLFAGYAALSSGELKEFLTPAMLRSVGKLALYINEGSGEVSAQALSSAAAALRNYGFTNVLAESRDGGHALVVSSFEPVTMHMMAFFDQALAAQDKNTAATKK